MRDHLLRRSASFLYWLRLALISRRLNRIESRINRPGTARR